MEALKVCTLASEVTPFAKSGGLGDVVAALSGFLHRRGHDVRVFLPLYATTDRSGRTFTPVDFLQGVPLTLGRWHLHFSVYTAPHPASGLPLYFIHCPELFGRDRLYTEHWDEHLRFALLTRAGIECCQRMGWSPQIVHCHDWHTSLAPFFLQTTYAWDRLFSDTRTVLTLHNLGYQGTFDAEVLSDLGLSDSAHLLYQEDLQAGRLNFLKTGILYADLLTTVSETYAREIQTPEQGLGLHDLLRSRSGSLLGITNGVDYDVWSPEKDRWIPFPYSAGDLEGKARDKEHLLGELGLPRETGPPVMGIVSRLTHQKGFDLLFDTLPPLLAREDLKVAALGSGEDRYEGFLGWLQRSFPRQVCFYRGYHEPLAHLIEAGADLFLMPSLYEPCGLNQMYSLRYGTVPVVRRTGGLADTVEPFDPKADSGTGFVFEHFTAAGLGWALGFALHTFRERPEAWRRVMLRGMARDFSWNHQGALYEDAYRRLLGS